MISELREQNCLQSELSFNFIVYYLHIFLQTKRARKKSLDVEESVSQTMFYFWSKCVLQILVWNKWDSMTFEALKEFMVRFLFENHETLQLEFKIFRSFVLS